MTRRQLPLSRFELALQHVVPLRVVSYWVDSIPAKGAPDRSSHPRRPLFCRTTHRIHRGELSTVRTDVRLTPYPAQRKATRT